MSTRNLRFNNEFDFHLALPPSQHQSVTTSKANFEELSVSGTTFMITNSLMLYIKNLPIFPRQSSGKVAHLNADPRAFNWVLHWLHKHSFPDYLLVDEIEMDAVRSLALTLELHGLLGYLERKRNSDDAMLTEDDRESDKEGGKRMFSSNNMIASIGLKRHKISMLPSLPNLDLSRILHPWPSRKNRNRANTNLAFHETVKSEYIL